MVSSGLETSPAPQFVTETEFPKPYFVRSFLRQKWL